MPIPSLNSLQNLGKYLNQKLLRFVLLQQPQLELFVIFFGFRDLALCPPMSPLMAASSLVRLTFAHAFRWSSLYFRQRTTLLSDVSSLQASQSQLLLDFLNTWNNTRTLFLDAKNLWFTPLLMAKMLVGDFFSYFFLIFAKFFFLLQKRTCMCTLNNLCPISTLQNTSPKTPEMIGFPPCFVLQKTYVVSYCLSTATCIICT